MTRLHRSHSNSVEGARWRRRLVHLLCVCACLSVGGAAVLLWETVAARAADPERGPSGTEVASDGAPGPAPGAMPSAALAPLQVSDPPTDQEILVLGILPQPLAPVGGPANADENRALLRALLRYRRARWQGAAPDAVSPLTEFLQAHPASRWDAAVSLNLGLLYRQTGHLSKALQVWQHAWEAAKAATDPQGRAIADYTIGVLAKFEAYLGRMETLAPLLEEVQGRPLHGSGAELISDASEGLAQMRTRPEVSFLCGPLAVQRLALAVGHPAEAAVLAEARSTPQGTSLPQVLEWAHTVGLDYQMAYRAPGAALLVPAVLHWQVGHFAALVSESEGLYQVEDPTFGENIQVSRATLDEEASGYFVVPAGPLPPGWRSVSAAEGERIWGRGFDNTKDDKGTSEDDKKCGKQCSGSCEEKQKSKGITTADVHLLVVGLTLHDTPLEYATPKGLPVQFELFYSHRDALQPALFTSTNFGPKWTSTWISYFTDNPNNTADLYLPGGGGESYAFNGPTSSPGVHDQALVTKLVAGGHTRGFTRTLPDGSVQTFTQPFGTNQFFLSAVSDPQGNQVTLTYDAHMRITALTDAAGEVTTLSYGLASDIYKVTKVTDPFGRSATFTYTSDGQLASITDMLGLTSRYDYLFGSGDFISTLTTPYGTSEFTYGDATTDYHLGTTRYVTLTDPLGQTARVESRPSAPGITASDPPETVPTDPLRQGRIQTDNTYLFYRNTFVWNPHQLALATAEGGLDYTQATIFHFAHLDYGVAGRTLESIKEPLENRVWFNYPGQHWPLFSHGEGSANQPSTIGRVLDDGTTQLWTFQRNAFGHVTHVTDPLGRQFTFTYDTNGIDLLASEQTSGTPQRLQSLTYNHQHEPLTITDAAGQVTTLSYNAAGQVLQVTDALHETTRFTYSPTGLLLTITRPFPNAVTTFTYDTFNRLRSATDSQGYQVRYSYDAGDRLTAITYPDTTHTQFAYTRLDLTAFTDRLSRTTHYTYDALRRPIQVTDPLGRTTHYEYCDCGALAALTDPNGHKTAFLHDLEGRLMAKTFADHTQTTFTYEDTTSRLHSVTDALGQVTIYTYNVDDTLAGQSYSHALHPTPPVQFTWDLAFTRLLDMTDGTGATTYTYRPIMNPPKLGAGQLARITGPHGDVVSYAYDALGRRVQETLDGAVSQVSFDALGRFTTATNPLDTFHLSYLGATELPVHVQATHGVSTAYTYFGNQGDERLKSIAHTSPSSALLAGFQYAYDVAGEVTSMVIQKQFASTLTRTLRYDAAGQLVGQTASSGSPYRFGYDPGANRTSETTGATTTTFAYNQVNELTAPSPVHYDSEGEPLTLGNATYTWDAAGRLLTVIQGNHTTTFSYDGFDRRTRITQRTGTTVVSDKFYFWCGSTLCLETDAAHPTTITKRYFPQGVVVQGQPLYYARDALGSVRELVDAGGSVQASYDYDPFGVRTKLMGSQASDFGFAGLFHEAQSGLDLAMYRAYDAPRGRWLSRDPIGEAGGINLYSYVDNAPINLIDPAGQQSLFQLFLGGFEGSLTIGGPIAWIIERFVNGPREIVDQAMKETVDPFTQLVKNKADENINQNKDPGRTSTDGPGASKHTDGTGAGGTDRPGPDSSKSPKKKKCPTRHQQKPRSSSTGGPSSGSDGTGGPGPGEPASGGPPFQVDTWEGDKYTPRYFQNGHPVYTP